MKKLQFVKIKCQCGYTNPVPIYEVFHVYEPIRCEKCNEVIAELKKIIGVKNRNRVYTDK